MSMTEASIGKAPACLNGHPDVAAAYLDFMASKASARRELPQIAACGMYNVGKSSLLNVLVGRFAENDEAFATGAARVTRCAPRAVYDGVLFIDTPGVDGAQGDDDRALAGVLRADLFLYAHRLAMAELDQSEIRFLRSLAQRVDALDTRLALVVTQIDEVSDARVAAECEAAIMLRFEAAAGFRPAAVFRVSASRFMRGLLEEKDSLVSHSGIPQLRERIARLAGAEGQALCRDLRQARLETEKRALTQQLEMLIAGADFERGRLAKSHEAFEAAFEKAAGALVAKVRAAVRRIDAVS